MTRRVSAIAIASLALFLPVAWSLGREVPSESVRPFPDTPNGEAVAVELGELSYLRASEQARIFRVPLFTKQPAALAAHTELRLQVATYGTAPSLERGELYFDGTDCVFTTPAAASFDNNEYLAFTRGPRCRPLNGTPSGVVKLTLRFMSAGRVSLWTSAASDAGAAGDEPTLAHHSIRGFAVDIDPSDTERRSDLLAHVWEVSATSRWIWTAVFGSTLLLGCAAALVSSGRAERTRSSLVASRAGAMFCASAALGLVYAVLVPPFQAADEPNHFMGFAAFIGRAGTYEEASLWARRAHFERIQFHPEQHFRPSDQRVLGTPWDDGGGPDAETRGTGITWLWSAVAPIVRHQPIQRMLLSLRLTDVLLFAVACAAFGGLVGRFIDLHHPEFLALPLFLVPTLPFFAMTVSNYAPLVAAYTVLAAGVLIHFIGGEKRDAAGAVIGSGFALALLISRSALPLSPLIACLLASRAIVGGSGGRFQSAWIFWAGFACAATVGCVLANPTYVRLLVSTVLHSLGSSGEPSPGVLTGARWIAGPSFLLGAPIEYQVTRVVRRMRTLQLESILVWWLRIEAATVAIMIVLSGFIAYPFVARIDPAAPPSRLAYTREAVSAGLTFFRLAHHDTSTSTSFWGGFGWLDTIPRAALITALSTATAAAFMLTLTCLARRRMLRAAIVMQGILAGYVVALAAYAFGVAAATPADLHGRYLLGLYLCVLAPIWSGVALAVETTPPRMVAVTRLACTVACLGAHAVCITTILARYF